MWREKWPNKIIYIIAAIGAAAGLGNLWRFPMLAYDNGGGAFILALLLSNILIVLPLVMMETVIGQKYQLGGPQAFFKLKKGTSWIQWVPIFAGIFVLAYYVPIMAQGLTYFVKSFTGKFMADPVHYFNDNILWLTSDITISGWLQWTLVVALIVCLIFVLFSMWKWLKSVSKVLKYVATLPFLLLIIIAIRGLTLPGGVDGMLSLFSVDRSALWNISLWQAAIGQSFFSASLAMGYFFFMWSHRDIDDEIPKTSIWILSGNFLVSLLSGIAIFSTIWFLSHQSGLPISEAVTGGTTLVFSVLPQAISAMPFFQIGMAAILFIAVLFLAVGSIFWMLETIISAFVDFVDKYEQQLKITLYTVLVTFLLAIPFIMGAGMHYLDITDHFVGWYLYMIIWMLETFVLAYFVWAKKIRTWINQTTTLKFGKWFDIILYVVPWGLLYTSVLALWKDITHSYGGYPTAYLRGFGYVPLIIVILASFGMWVWTYIRYKKKNDLSEKEILDIPEIGKLW